MNHSTNYAAPCDHTMSFSYQLCSGILNAWTGYLVSTSNAALTNLCSDALSNESVSSSSFLTSLPYVFVTHVSLRSFPPLCLSTQIAPFIRMFCSYLRVVPGLTFFDVCLQRWEIHLQHLFLCILLTTELQKQEHY